MTNIQRWIILYIRGLDSFLDNSEAGNRVSASLSDAETAETALGD